MEKKFTPGEWRRPSIYATHIVDKRGRQIADAPILTSQGMTHEEGEANAKLISAAPDMYEALQYCHNRLQSLQSYFDAPGFTDRYGDSDKNKACIEIVDEAIKKATL